MERIFFHNPYDKESINQLNNLSDVVVYNVFSADGIIKDDIPSIFHLSTLPYLIDKQIVLDTIPPYYVGVISLSFTCKDYQDNVLTNEIQSFSIIINGNVYSDIPENGVLTIELECTIPSNISIRIDSYGYYPYEGIIEVVESA
jgi:hypothetical protein